MAVPERPDPDLLLARVREEQARASRGRLKIFLGASPGVGKTFAMLEAAQALRAAGTDVVVGVVETHGRQDTARLLDGLERLPPRQAEHRGVTLGEFDLDAALRRAPGVLLVDELAHSNAPGSRHAKRWQDVAELVDAGIDVLATLNIQHIESLNDLVAQITGVVVRETVPDAVLDEAAEIELVDVSPEVLLQRLREGKVYLGDAATRALERFFRRSNLIALRELALRRTAQRVDAERLHWTPEEGSASGQPVSERILVALPAGDDGLRLLRAGWRLAQAWRGECVALHVEGMGAGRASRDADLAAAYRLAADLGIRVSRVTGGDVATEILAWARQERITRIVVGAAPRGWRRPWRRSVAARLVAADGHPDLELVALSPAAAPPRDPLPRRRAGVRAYLVAIACVGMAAVAGRLVRDILSTADVAMLFLLAVAVAGARTGLGPGLAAAVASIAVFDLVFVPPYYTFAVSDGNYLLTFLVMLGVAVAMSRLASWLREEAEGSRHRERRTAALLRVAEELADTGDAEGVGRVLRQRLADSTGDRIVILLPDGDGRLAPVAGSEMVDDKEMAVARWAFDHGAPAGAGTGTLQGAGAQWLPMLAGDRAIGVIGVFAPQAGRTGADERRQLLDAVAAQGAVALERLQLARRSEHDRIEIEAERLRTALLSSLSHDLRTPLAAVEGAASTLLRDETDPARRELLDMVRSEGRRMEQLVRNLLGMVRMESGMLQVREEWESLEEVIGLVLIRMADRLAPFVVRTAVPADLPLIRGDGLLLEQVLVNLLENAAKHAPAGSEITIGVREKRHALDLLIEDRGPGVSGGSEEKIFDKFFQGPGARGSGVGLGLAICRGIVTAHGGTIHAENREGGGLRVVVTLPLPQHQPDPVPEVAG